MNEISNDMLLTVLLDIKGDVGKLVQGQATLASTQGVQGESINKLQLSQARQRGVIAALTTVGTLLGTAAGYAIDVFTMRGTH